MRVTDARIWHTGLTAVLGLALGCGTTRTTDTQRTATEQLLISNAVDQAVSQLDFRSLAGKSVYFDPQYLDACVDRGYVVSSMRQHLLASGCLLQDDRAKAAYVVEARTGAVGTDRHSLLVGVPQMTLPTLVPGQPSQIPEIPFAKKTDQIGTAKLAVFAYHRATGHPVWQSGVIQSVSTAKDTWLMGAGPFQKGTIRSGVEFAGVPLPTFHEEAPREDEPPPVISVTQELTWPDQGLPPALARQVGEFLGATTLGNPVATGALLRARFGGAAGGPGSIWGDPEAAAAAPAPAPAAPPPPSAEVQQPNSFYSGLDLKTDLFQNARWFRGAGTGGSTLRKLLE